VKKATVGWSGGEPDSQPASKALETKA